MQNSYCLNPHIELEGHKIGKSNPVFIIAEIGINHDGQFRVAKEMIDHAAQCGVDCIKFQTFRTHEFLSDRTLMYDYVVNGKTVSENMFKMFKRLELPVGWHKELFQYVSNLGLIPLTSVADMESADMVEDLGIQAFKLSSEDLINLPLIEHIAKKHKPIIFSTGMADETEIEDVLKILRKYRSNKVIFMHCVSLYPTLPEEVHLKRMQYLASKVMGPVGYSDHTTGVEACLGAVVLGACAIEKHFTLNKNRVGPDHSFSADPNELKLLVKSVRTIEKMIGDSKPDQSDREIEMRKLFRRSIVAARDLDKGKILSIQDVSLKRPGNGLRARETPRLIGKQLKKSARKDDLIDFSMLN